MLQEFLNSTPIPFNGAQINSQCSTGEQLPRWPVVLTVGVYVVRKLPPVERLVPSTSSSAVLSSWLVSVGAIASYSVVDGYVHCKFTLLKRAVPLAIVCRRGADKPSPVTVLSLVCGFAMASEVPSFITGATQDVGCTVIISASFGPSVHLSHYMIRILTQFQFPRSVVSSVLPSCFLGFRFVNRALSLCEIVVGYVVVFFCRCLQQMHLNCDVTRKFRLSTRSLTPLVYSDCSPRRKFDYPISFLVGAFVVFVFRCYLLFDQRTRCRRLCGYLLLACQSERGRNVVCTLIGDYQHLVSSTVSV